MFVCGCVCSGDGLGGLVFCVLGGVDRALETLTRMMLVALREREFQKKKATIPLYLLLPCSLLWFLCLVAVWGFLECLGLSWFRSSCLRRVFADYYFFVGGLPHHG